jgi:hypothetical protein
MGSPGAITLPSTHNVKLMAIQQPNVMDQIFMFNMAHVLSAVLLHRRF